MRDLDLSVAPGEVVALLGPNGAGKSTTLLALTGVLRPMKGTVLWDGVERWQPLHRRARSGLSYIPEERSAFGGLTVAQNIAVSRKASMRSEVEALFPEMVELRARRASLLSGGEQRMLGVGCALGGGCRLLVADELSLGLAPKTVGRILRAIRKAADEGVGALVVEQHVHRVLEIADRVYVMEGGQVRFSGTAAAARSQLSRIREHYLSTSGELSASGAGPAD